MRYLRVEVVYRGSQLLVALLLAVCMVLLPAVVVRAQPLHAVLLASDPAAGSVLNHPVTAIKLSFSETFQPTSRSIVVRSPTGIEVQQGSPLMHGLELSMPIRASSPGTYLVTWQVISQDTDPSSGRFVFSITREGGLWVNASGSDTGTMGLVLQTGARVLHFLGYALGFGVLAFLVLVLYPLHITGEEIMRRLWRLVAVGILLLLLAEGVALLAQIATLTTGSLFDPVLLGDVLASSFGRVMAQRLGAAVLLWVIAGSAQQGQRMAIWGAIVLGILLALVDCQASHALSSYIIWLGVPVNVLHILAMGVWIGGLVALVVIWSLPEIRVLRSAITVRFGRLAAIAVVELVLSGLLLVWLHLQRPADLFTTGYGIALTIKLVMFPLPILCAFVSQRVAPSLRIRWWQLELLLLLLVILLASLLVSLPPPV